MSEKRKVDVSILGQKYTIVGDEDDEHVQMVARYVDLKMRELRRRNPMLDTPKTAVLVAVNVVNDYVKVLQELENLKKQNEKNES